MFHWTLSIATYLTCTYVHSATCLGVLYDTVSPSKFLKAMVSCLFITTNYDPVNIRHIVLRLGTTQLVLCISDKPFNNYVYTFKFSYS